MGILLDWGFMLYQAPTSIWNMEGFRKEYYTCHSGVLYIIMSYVGFSSAAGGSAIDGLWWLRGRTRDTWIDNRDQRKIAMCPSVSALEHPET